MRVLRWGLPTLVLALSSALPGCISGPGGDGADGGPLDGEAVDAPPNVVTDLTIRGRGTLPIGGPAAGSVVTARCGPEEVIATADGAGRYELQIDVRTCADLVVHIERPGFLPFIRRIPLPAPTSPLDLDFEHGSLKQLACGTESCGVAGDPAVRFPAVPIQQGWVQYLSGDDAVAHVPGELVDGDGDLLWFIGIAYLDFRDGDGNPLATLDPFPHCFQVPSHVHAWLVDTVPAMDDVQLHGYALDAATGRWVRRPAPFHVRYTKTVEFDELGNPYDVIEPLPTEELPNVRSGAYNATRMWACTPIAGNGWLAWGQGIPERTCYLASARSHCNKPLSNVRFRIRGKGVRLRQPDLDRRGRQGLPRGRPVRADRRGLQPGRPGGLELLRRRRSELERPPRAETVPRGSPDPGDLRPALDLRRAHPDLQRLRGLPVAAGALWAAAPSRGGSAGAIGLTSAPQAA